METTLLTAQKMSCPLLLSIILLETLTVLHVLAILVRALRTRKAPSLWQEIRSLARRMQASPEPRVLQSFHSTLCKLLVAGSQAIGGPTPRDPKRSHERGP
ncbi:unnamed protein product [Effrenium voratum]|nr:unnamed protein product [Effrenium voratum]